MAGRLEKVVKAVKNKVTRKKPSTLRKAATVAGVAAAVAGAGLAARAIAKKRAGRSRKKKR